MKVLLAGSAWYDRLPLNDENRSTLSFNGLSSGT